MEGYNSILTESKICVLLTLILMSICRQNLHRAHLLRRPSVLNSSVPEFHFCHRVKLARRMAPPTPVKLKCHTEFSTCGLSWKGTMDIAMRARLLFLGTS